MLIEILRPQFDTRPRFFREIISDDAYNSALKYIEKWKQKYPNYRFEIEQK